MPTLEPAAPRRLLVVWRDFQEIAGLHDVGVLTFDGSYRFNYLEGARTPGFVPFSNFPDEDRSYVSSRLFPFFSSRVMARDRPDFARLCVALDLPPTASDLALLDRTGGTRKGDRVAVVGEPVIDDSGHVDHVMVVRGVRFVLEDAVMRNEILGLLKPGDALSALRDIANPVNPEALLIQTLDGTNLGWIPDRLVPFATRVLDSSGSLSVHRVNGDEQPPHLRLLVRIVGAHPTNEPTLPPLGVFEQPLVAAVS